MLPFAGQLQSFVVAKQNAVRIIVALPLPLYLPKEEQHSGDKDFIFIPLKLEVLFIQYVYRNKPEVHLHILEALKVQQEEFYIYITSPKSVFLLVCLWLLVGSLRCGGETWQLCNRLLFFSWLLLFCLLCHLSKDWGFVGLLKDHVLHLYSEGCGKPSIINYNVHIPLGDNLALLHLHCSSEHLLHLHLFKSAYPECPPWPILWDDSHSWNFLAWLLKLNKGLKPFSNILSGFIRKNVVCPSYLDCP